MRLNVGIPYLLISSKMPLISLCGTLSASINTAKRIYADWTKPHVSGWKSVLLEYAITPIQQYSYTTGKNSSDSALIIDAMDILYTGRVDGFCIVSSDSDFTKLAIRLREAGMKVFGLGEQKTPSAFRSACDKFIYIEILKEDENIPEKDKKSPAKKDKSISKTDNNLIKFLKSSVNDIADENGWAFLGELGNFVLKKKPDFDSRNYGYEKLLPLIKSLGKFEIDERDTGRKNVKLVYIRSR